MYYVIYFRQSMCDIWVTKISHGGEQRRYYVLQDAQDELEKVAHIYGKWNVKIVDKYGMLVRE